MRNVAALNKRSIALPCGGAPALVLGEGIEPRLLLVVQEAVEFVQRRLHYCHPRYHRLDALLHGREPARRRQRYLCRAGRLDVVRGRRGSVGDLVERGTLRPGQFDGPLNQINRQASNIAAGVTAQLRQPVGR